MNKTTQRTLLVAIALTGMFISSCGPTPVPSKPSTETASAKKIKIKIQNKSYHNAVVKVEGPEKKTISVPARSSSVVYLKSGIYQYEMRTKNTRMQTGYKFFADRRSITWRLGSN